MHNLEAIRETMLTEARKATEEYLNRYYGGRDGGACGFAWVAIYPKHKGNTKLGKAERSVLKQLGFKQDWTGRGYQFWNPSQHPCQSVDAKAAGAAAAANVLKQYGFSAYAGDKLD